MSPASARSRGLDLRIVQRALLGLVFPALLLVLWETLCLTGAVPPNLLPPPRAVLRVFGDLAASGMLWTHIAVTLRRVLEGFLCGTAVATALGALTGYAPLWRRILDPTFQALRAVPSIAWVPLFVLWLSIFETSKVTLIALGAFFPVYLSTMAGIQQVDRKLVEVARIHGYGGIALVRRVLLPSMLPAYLVGLRGGLGLAWMFVAAAEYLGSEEGVGYLLLNGEQMGRAAEIIAPIMLFAVLGKASDLVLARLGRPLVAWQDSFESTLEKKIDAADPPRLQEV